MAQETGTYTVDFGQSCRDLGLEILLKTEGLNRIDPFKTEKPSRTFTSRALVGHIGTGEITVHIETSVQFLVTLVSVKIFEAKERILILEEDWDDEGCPAYQEKTIDAAAQFLYQLDSPSVTNVRIAPAGEGSIDLHWKMDKFELLINFHPDGSVSYYGDDYNGNLIRGSSCPKPGLISCWMEHTSE